MKLALFACGKSGITEHYFVLLHITSYGLVILYETKYAVVRQSKIWEYRELPGYMIILCA